VPLQAQLFIVFFVVNLKDAQFSQLGLDVDSGVVQQGDAQEA
jgi:hypothetical protein